MERNQRILVVDDQEDLRTQVARMLEQKSAGSEMRGLIEQIRHRIGKGREVPVVQESAAYEVDTVAQGKDAYELVRAAFEADNPYAVMFLDMRMPPGWDGLETAQRIRSVDKDVQVVIMTAYADYEQREIAEKIGEPDKLIYLKKPFHPEEIRQLALALSEKWNLNRREKERLILTNRLMRENGFLTRQPFASLDESYNALLNAFVSFLDASAGILGERQGTRTVLRAATSTEDGQALLDKLDAQTVSSGRVMTRDDEGNAYLPLIFGEFDGFIFVQGKNIAFSYEQLRPFMDILMETARSVLRNAFYLHRQQLGRTAEATKLLVPKLAGKLQRGIDALEPLADKQAASGDNGKAGQQAIAALRRLNNRLQNLHEAATCPLVNEYLTIKEWFRAALDPLNQEFANLDVLIKQRIEPEDLVVQADRKALVAALRELLQNSLAAIKAADQPAGGQHELRLSAGPTPEGDDPTQISIAVVDTAAGLPPDVPSQLFTPLVQHDDDLGSGLGLAISHELITRLGGELLWRPKPEAGTTFEIRLPATS